MSKTSVLALLVLVFCVACSSSREAAEAPASVRPTAGTVRSALVTSDYKSLVLGDGAVGYWRLNDTGLNAADSAPRGNTGTYVDTYPTDGALANQNQPGAIWRESDGSAEFFVSNNYNHSPPTQTNWITIPSDPNQSPTSASLSVEAWFTISPGILQTYASIVSKSTSNWQDGYGLYWYSGTLYFFINNLNIRVGVAASAMGDTTKFHHVVGVYDGTAIKIYYDGALANSATLTAAQGQGLPVHAPPAALQIGKSWINLGWTGRIDEVAIYPSALDAGKVLSHFQTARPPGPLSRAFVAYAQQGLTFGTGDHVVGGDVGVASVASSSAGTQLVVGASDVFDVQRGVFAPSVSLGSQAQIGGVSTNTLANNGGSLGTRQSFPTSMPRLPLVPAGAPGTTNVTILTGKTQTLYPGSYGAIVVNGTARLAAGAYSFSSLTVGAGGVVMALPWANTTIRVDTTLTTGTGASLVQASDIAGGLVISVAGRDASSSVPAVSLGANNGLVAVLNAPHGTVSIGDGTSVTGALSAFAIHVGNNVTLALDAGATTAGDQPVGLQQLTGHITPAIAAAPLVGPVPSSVPIGISIGLPLRNAAALASLVAQASDPASPNYRQELLFNDFMTTYGPTSSDYQQLTDFATSHGLSVSASFPNRVVLGVRGTASAIEQALHVNLNLYLRPDGTLFFAADREPSLDLTVPVAHVSSLDNYLGRPHNTVIPGGNGSGTGGNYMARDLRKAYAGCLNTSQNGAAQSVALLEFSGYNQADLNAYATASGLTLSPPVFVSVDGGQQDIDIGSTFSMDDALETTLDIEAVNAIAPGASVFVIVGTAQNLNIGGGIVGPDDLLAAVASRPDIKQASLSATGIPWDANTESILLELAAQRQTVFVSSGDDGAYRASGEPGDDWRASPEVTVVGGTVLSMVSPGAAYLSESAWLDSLGASGGGIIQTPAPTFQRNSGIDFASLGGDPAQRNVPDVATVATDFEGFVTCGQPGIDCSCPPVPVAGKPFGNCTSHPELALLRGYQVTLGGTSLSSPLWAGFLALANQLSISRHLAAVGVLNPVVYAMGRSPAYATSFHDITTGSTGRLSARTGYDLTTGWGSPKCALFNQLASMNPTTPQAPSAPVVAPTPLIGVGIRDTCAVAASLVECWGSDPEGEDGTGTTSVDRTPHLTPACTQTANQRLAASTVTVGADHACAAFQDGNVRCWGDNTYGQLGTTAVGLAQGTTKTIAGLPQLGPVKQLVAGGGLTCALYGAGAVWCWGENRFGQLGIGTTGEGPNPTPTQVQNLPPVAQIGVAPSAAFVCALLQSGGVDCWGLNQWGNLGNGTTTSVARPQPVLIGGQPLMNIIGIALGDMHACAIVDGGGSFNSLLCWGNNLSSQLGEGVPSGSVLTQEPSPVLATQVSGATPLQVTGAIASDSSTCVLLADGTVRCWGSNAVGELGITGPTSSAVPVVVPTLTGVTGLAAGESHLCAVNSAGALTCWGTGPIGNGRNDTVDQPQTIPLRTCP